MTLLDACREVMNDPTTKTKYPDGISSFEMLAEIQERTGGFKLCTFLDVHDEMEKFYGKIK